MISGNIILEDVAIEFYLTDDCMACYSITDLRTGDENHSIVEQSKFLKALAIAVHNDGMPYYIDDYPDAESIQGTIRWIP